MIHTLATAAMAITLSHAPRKSEIPRLRPRTGPPARWAIHLVKRSTGKTFPVPFNLSRVRLERLPLVAEKDVRSYHWATHRLVLRKSTLRRLKRIRRSLVGRRFVVVVGKNRLYAGTIATPLWSKSSRWEAPPVTPDIEAVSTTAGPVKNSSRRAGRSLIRGRFIVSEKGIEIRHTQRKPGKGHGRSLRSIRVEDQYQRAKLFS